MHRIAHSKYGGIFQPTMTQVIRLLSDPHAKPTSAIQPAVQQPGNPTPSSLPPSDPFSASELTYTTNGLDSFPAPSFYPSRRHSWIHVFPEGKIHQHPDKIMRYFKWGVARMILESEPCPDVMCMWIDGPQFVMANERTFPDLCRDPDTMFRSLLARRWMLRGFLVLLGSAGETSKPRRSGNES